MRCYAIYFSMKLQNVAITIKTNVKMYIYCIAFRWSRGTKSRKILDCPPGIPCLINIEPVLWNRLGDTNRHDGATNSKHDCCDNWDIDLFHHSRNKCSRPRPPASAWHQPLFSLGMSSAAREIVRMPFDKIIWIRPSTDWYISDVLPMHPRGELRSA